ncbi:hypothetical protein AYO45_01655 [Gammaproteobacteria bacterium SCGC AG-212-F23]|nr:hypothetical protein AYO45_01655 [Gammaproteobacteria bacterium SCGC AG-212-F23]
MSLLNITFRSMTNSPAIKYQITKYFNKINRLYSKITYCRVVMDVLHKHSNKGKMFSVNIAVIIPGKEIVSKKQDKNIYVAMHGTFDAIEKLLERHCKRSPVVFDKRHIEYKNDVLGEISSAVV